MEEERVPEAGAPSTEAGALLVTGESTPGGTREVEGTTEISPGQRIKGE